MMRAHLTQAGHNQRFISACNETYPELFFDWKVTASFYTALHMLRAFCIKRGVDPGRTHYEIAQNLNPRSIGNQVTPFPEHIWNCYNKLRIYSEQARYEGFIDPETENEIQRDNYLRSGKLLSSIMAYFFKHGVFCEYKPSS